MAYNPSIDNLVRLALGGAQRGLDRRQQNQAELPSLYLTLQKMMQDRQDEAWAQTFKQDQLSAEAKSSAATNRRLQIKDLEDAANDRRTRAQADERLRLDAERNAGLNALTQVQIGRTKADTERLKLFKGATATAELNNKRMALSNLLTDIRDEKNYIYKTEKDFKKLTPPEQGMWEPMLDADGELLKYRSLKPNLKVLHDRTVSELKRIGGIEANPLFEVLSQAASGSHEIGSIDSPDAAAAELEAMLLRSDQ
jgi:hypothetical protein